MYPGDGKVNSLVEVFYAVFAIPRALINNLRSKVSQLGKQPSAMIGYLEIVYR